MTDQYQHAGLFSHHKPQIWMICPPPQPKINKFNVILYT